MTRRKLIQMFTAFLPASLPASLLARIQLAKPPENITVLCQMWVRPNYDINSSPGDVYDKFTMHLTETDLDTYIQAELELQKRLAMEYIYDFRSPKGQPIKWTISKREWAKILASVSYDSGISFWPRVPKIS